MSFTSNFFLIGLLPWFVILVYVTRKKKNFKRFLILLANTFFYLWGGIGAYFFICLFSVVIWLFTIILFKKKKRILLRIFICLTMIPLLAVKYTGFLIENVNKLMYCGIKIPNIVMPVGISFFTFEAISLLCDVYSEKIKEKMLFGDVYLYLLFFPTIMSGPIIESTKPPAMLGRIV